MVADGVKGERITLRGQVFDGLGTPLRDALIEVWQADADGLYPSVERDARAGRPGLPRLGADVRRTWRPAGSSSRR